MKNLIILLLLACAATVTAQNVYIIPKPVSMDVGKGSFTLSKATVLVLDDEGEQNTANFFNDYLKRFYGFSLPIAKSATANYIRFGTNKFIRPGTEGKYRMLISPLTLNIEGDTYQGTFYGMQTLIQLLPVPNPKIQKINLPTLTIEDYPRFSYRGLHLDVGRHFMPVDFVKKYIDYIALHKMNYFHWHLTEDQGWRIEIKKYPRLTEVGAYRNGTIIGRYPGKGNDNKPYGGFYTQEEVKEVVDYAAKRFVTIVPEIEMPGHGSAAIAAYPWLSCFPAEKTKIPDNMISEASKSATGKLVQETWGVFDDVFCAGKDSTFSFLQDVIDEVIQLFPGQYIHVGGDECPKNNWKRCPNCQQRMKDHNLKDEHHLQSYFIQRMEKYINSKGKTLIGWDEILEGGLAPNAIVMSWRGEQGGIDAAKENHQVIMTPGNYVYLDHSQSKNEDSVVFGSYTPLEETYGYEPVPKQLPADKAKFVLGAQGNVWTEYMNNPRKVEYMIFPRLSALSEVLWTQKQNRVLKDFELRLSSQFKRYNLWKANFSKAYYDMKISIKPTTTRNGVSLEIQPRHKDGIIRYQPIGKPTPLKYSSPLVISDSRKMVITYFYNNQLADSVSLNISFNKATGKKINVIKEPIAAYPGEGGTFGLVNGIRSEKDITSSEWLGWRGDDMEAIIDLGKPQSISNVGIHALKSGGSRVHPPAELQVFGSLNGQTFSPLGTNGTFVEDKNKISGYIKIQFNPVDARYVKVIAKNYTVIPEGKSGAGDPALMLIDEIIVN
ncbi:MAG TPA: family 20 glycosylhydrolase [Chitinophagaceae bacterium]|nr:family 20 glycosylhydrolase [Chitinophagaceae bacterium]